MSQEPTIDRELEDWREAWRQGQGPSAADAAALRERFQRETRWLVAEEAAGVVLILLVSWALALAFARAEGLLELALVAGLAAAVLVFAAFGFLTWRGLWRSEAANLQAHLELSVRRQRRRLACVRAGWILLVWEIALFVPWVHLRLAGPAGELAPWSEAWPYYGLLAGVGLSEVLWLRWLARGARRRLAELERWLDPGSAEE
jgi:hypothetical protein